VCRSQNGVNHLMGEGTGHGKLDKFEKLIRDAIALLIKRGEISISQKKPCPRKDQTQRESSSVLKKGLVVG